MKIKRLHPDFTIATQIREDKVPKIAKHGFRTLMCNRPDHEATDQPDFDSIRRLAEPLGMTAVHIPISLQGATKDDQQRFNAAVQQLPKPIFAYCRSGIRCSGLWNSYLREA